MIAPDHLHDPITMMSTSDLPLKRLRPLSPSCVVSSNLSRPTLKDIDFILGDDFDKAIPKLAECSKIPRETLPIRPTLHSSFKSSLTLKRRRTVTAVEVSLAAAAYLRAESAAWNELLPLSDTLSQELAARASRFLGLSCADVMVASLGLLPWQEIVCITGSHEEHGPYKHA
jgi:hypothetical protein